jgi:hypothetical protein
MERMRVRPEKLRPLPNGFICPELIHQLLQCVKVLRLHGACVLAVLLVAELEAYEEVVSLLCDRP